MRKFPFVLLSLFLILIISCQIEEKYSYLRAVNSSVNPDYEDVITDIYISENATQDNFRSIWNGKLKPGQSTILKINCGNFGVKFKGTRYYHSGIEKAIDVTTGYRTPVSFASFWTFRLIFDGEGLYAKEED